MQDQRLYSLDAARGLAAIAVVVWHWQHFYWFDGRVDIARSIQPFYAFMKPFYEFGYLGVDFFFVLSGFIFYWLYSDKVASQKSSAKQFSILRFSRLYPLHVITLVFVAALQLMRPSDFVYPSSSEFLFVLQLFMVQSWIGIDYGITFNGPAWSLSVEVFLYCVFWVTCRLRFGSSWLGAFAIGMAGLAISTVSLTIGTCIAGFFFGGVTYFVYARFKSSATIMHLVIAATIAIWTGLTGAYLYSGFEFLMPLKVIAFPLTVLSLALAETNRTAPWEKLSWLGDISYSSYLIHFPLQLIIANLVLWGWLEQEIVRGEISFVLFFVILLIISRASYRWIELPAQRFVRGRFLPARTVQNRVAMT